MNTDFAARTCLYLRPDLRHNEKIAQGVNFMETIVQRSLSDGTLRYRAEIRINRKDFPAYKESKTFSTKRIAEKWVKKREVEIENNPDILNGNQHEKSIRLSDAIDLYLNETEGVYSKTKVNALKLIKKFPIAKKSIMKLNSMDLSDHVALRKTYCPKVQVGPVVPSTILHELLQIRSVLTHASVMWETPVDLNAFDRTTAQLRKTRQISASRVRDRLPTNDELIIIMFAVFSCRRQAELTRMELKDYDQELHAWKIKNVKTPKGSLGNNKEFSVSDECQRIIEILMRPEIRKRFKSKNSDKYLLPFSSATISTEFHMACKHLGIEDLRFHDLRHEGCTRLAEKGFTVPQIQQCSLHDSWQSLQRYVSLKKSHIKFR